MNKIKTIAQMLSSIEMSIRDRKQLINYLNNLNSQSGESEEGGNEEGGGESGGDEKPSQYPYIITKNITPYFTTSGNIDITSIFTSEEIQDIKDNKVDFIYAQLIAEDENTNAITIYEKAMFGIISGVEGVQYSQRNGSSMIGYENGVIKLVY